MHFSHGGNTELNSREIQEYILSQILAKKSLIVTTGQKLCAFVAKSVLPEILEIFAQSIPI
jgi:hypothetical protein